MYLLINLSSYLAGRVTCVAAIILLVSFPIIAQEASIRPKVALDTEVTEAGTVIKIVHWIQRLLGPNAQHEDLLQVLDWIANAKVTLKPPGEAFHDKYSNRYGISSLKTLSLKSYFGIPFGVNTDPWMSIALYRKGTALTADSGHMAA
jgi:hypothetical protein